MKELTLDEKIDIKKDALDIAMMVGRDKEALAIVNELQELLKQKTAKCKTWPLILSIIWG